MMVNEEAVSAAADKAERALIKAMGENPRRLAPGTIDVIGTTVTWEEQCRTNYKRSGGGACLHARTSVASREALDSFFGTVNNLRARAAEVRGQG